MQKTDNIPMWVYLAFSSITTRKGALFLIVTCVISTIYCIPWSQIFTHQEWVVKIFIIEDWSWFVMMVVITGWYWASLRWLDNNFAWVDNMHDKN